MAYPDTIPPPVWVSIEESGTRVIDPLGLRAVVQRMAASMLPGVTTVTVTARYIPLRTWLLYRYIHSPEAIDERKAFRLYARHAEGAFVLANTYADPSVTGLVGKGFAERTRETGEDILPAAHDVGLAEGIYAGASDELGLTKLRNPGLPALDDKRGVRLAEAVEETIGRTQIGQRLRDGRPLEVVSKAEIEDLAAIARPDAIPEPERSAFLDVLLPEDPDSVARRRLTTMALLLSLSDALRRPVTEGDVFEEALRPKPLTPDVFRPLRNRLAGYATRDCMAKTAEAALVAIHEVVRALDHDGTGASEDDVVRAVVLDSAPDHDDVFRRWGVLLEHERVSAVRFRTIRERLQGITSDATELDGIRRWNGELSEWQLQASVDAGSADALSSALLSWLVSERRLGIGVHERDPAFDELSSEGVHRFGLRQVVFPMLDAWSARNAALLDVLAELTHRIVTQHLETIWTRLATNSEGGISTLVRDGDRWFATNRHNAGRSGSRIPQAIGWLRQLGLVTDDGLSQDGRVRLQRALATLEES